MGNLSEIDNKDRSNEDILKIPSSISQPLKNFINEKNYLFDYYHRHKNLEEPPMSKLLREAIVDFFWRNKLQKILTFLIIICCTIISLQVFTKSLDRSLVDVIVVLNLLFLYLQTLLNLYNYNKKIKKRSVNDPTQWIDLAETYDLRNHQKVIKNIGENNSVRDIKLEEQRLKIVIISQSRAKNVADSAIPLLSFFSVILIFFVLGIPQNWENNLNIITKIAGFGITSLTISILTILAKLFPENLLIYQHCLFILQEALLIAEEREKSNKLVSIEDVNEKYEFLVQELKNITQELKTKDEKSSINKNIKGKNLFKELKKIKIVDAPSDFSTSFDSYINREESAGTDIH